MNDPAPPSWLIFAGGAVLVAGAAWWGWSTNPQPVSAPDPAALGATPPEVPLRPVVAMLGFDAPDDDPDDPRAAIAADAARYYLSFSDAMITVPIAALAGVVPPKQAVTPKLPLARLQRADGALGHVDLVVRGTLTELDGESQITAALTATEGAREVAEWSVAGPTDPILIGEAVARGIAQTLGTPLGETPPPTRSTAAYGAYLAARRAEAAGETGTFEHALRWALELDPNFADAQLLRFATLRAAGRNEDLAKEADALRKRTDLSPRQASLARAWAAVGHNKPAIALQALKSLVDREPLAVDAEAMRLDIRLHDPGLGDAAEAEVIAGRIRAIAPYHKSVAENRLKAPVLQRKDRDISKRSGENHDAPGLNPASP